MNDPVEKSENIDDPPSQSAFRWWLLFPLILAAVAFFFLRSQVAIANRHPAVGKPAPQIELVQLTDDLSLSPMGQIPKGKVTLIHLWGTWCGPCKLEYPHLAEMAGRYQSRPEFRFVPVTCESGRSETFDGLWKKTTDYFRSAEIDSVAYADPRGATRRSVAERLQNETLYYPTSLLIDHDGKIAGVWEGYSPDAVEQIAALTDQLIAACP